MRKTHCPKGSPRIIFFPVALLAFVFAGCKKDAFSKADLDCNGILSKQETSLVLLESIYSASDANGDARITFVEWKTVNPDAKKSLFEKRDLDRDGAVTPEELKAYSKREDSFEKLYAAMDLNSDGSIDRNEAKLFHEKIAAAESATNIQIR
jgi:Ca2+-binding EF-hand superfamily protein